MRAVWLRKSRQSMVLGFILLLTTREYFAILITYGDIKLTYLSVQHSEYTLRQRHCNRRSQNRRRYVIQTSHETS